MDTRKLKIETYACSCEGGTEYGLVLKDADSELLEGEYSLFDIVTHDRQLPAPRSEGEAYNANRQKDTAAELVRRWNAYPELIKALEGIVDLPSDDNGERTIPAGFLDQARQLLNTLSQ